MKPQTHATMPTPSTQSSSFRIGWRLFGPSASGSLSPWVAALAMLAMVIGHLAFSQTAAAQTVILDDQFNDAAIGVNPPYSGFVSTGQSGVIVESGGAVELQSTQPATAVIKSVDTFDPFSGARIEAEFVIRSIDRIVIPDASPLVPEGNRAWVGLGRASDSNNAFMGAYLGSDGLYVAINHDPNDSGYRVNDGAFATKPGLVVSRLGGITTILAEFEWDTYDGSGPLTVTITVTGSNYEVTLSEATTGLTGSLTGVLPGASSGTYVAGVHYQTLDGTTGTTSSMYLESVKVQSTSADLSITGITDAPDPVAAGETVDYVISWSNAGPNDADNAIVTVSVPAGMTFDSWPNCPAPAGNVCALTTPLAPGSGTVTARLMANLASMGTQNIGAVISSDTPDVVTGNESQSTNTFVNGVDWGDAPFETLFPSGARHEIVASPSHYLGGVPDSESDGQPTGDATGDGADEDGVAFLTSIVTGATPNVAGIDVTTYGSGYLSAWIDFDGSGSFLNDTPLFTDLALGTAATSVTTTLAFAVPTGAAPGVTFARFRFCSTPGDCNSPLGYSADGEVEDYEVTIIDEAAMGDAVVTLPNSSTATGPWTLGLTAGVLQITTQTPSPFTLFETTTPGGLSTLTIEGDAVSEELLVDYTNGDPIPSGGLTFNGNDGDDHLRLDLADQPLTPRLITFNGGGEVSGDYLTLENSVDAESYAILSVHDTEDAGTVYVEDDQPLLIYDDLEIAYTGLEPVIITLTLTDAEFQFNAAANGVVLNADGDPGGAGDGESFIDCTGCGESVEFTTPSNSLIVNLGDGADTIDFTSLDTPVIPTTILINGEDGEDRFNITANTTYGMVVDGGAPTTCNGDILDLDLSGVTGAYQTILAPGVGNWKFAAPGKTINFTNIEVRVDALTDVEVAVAWDDPSGYPADEREVTFTLTNHGSDEATCIRSALDIPAILNLFGAPVEVYPASASGSYAAGEWLVNRILSGDSATITFRGVINTLMPDVLSTSIDATAATAVLSNDPDRTATPTTNFAASNFTVENIYRFPAKGTAISAQYVELPSGMVRLVAGLFQGSPGFNTALLCRIPDAGPLFTQPGVGNHWKPCGDGLPIPLHVTDLFLDDRTLVGDVSDDRLWLASWGSAGLYYSDDYGESFVSASPNLGTGVQPWTNVYGITKDAGNVLYISANNGLVYRSLNAGQTWQQVASLPGASADTPWSMHAHPTAAGTVYAGTFGHGVFVTTDFGFTWEPLGGASRNDELLDTDKSGDDFAGHVFDMAFSPDGSGYLFIGTGKGVWRIPVDGVGQPTGAWEQMAITVALNSGPVVPEVRVLAFQNTLLDGDDNLLVGTWGFGAQINETPLAGGAFAPTALKEGKVSMMAIAPDGTVMVGSGDFGVEPITPEASSTASEPDQTQLPEGYALSQNYPNPFNPVTTIGFALPETGRVRLSVLDTLGREVAVLVDGHVQAGQHEVQFSAAGLPTGTYLYRLETGAGAIARTLILMK